VYVNRDTNIMLKPPIGCKQATRHYESLRHYHSLPGEGKGSG